MGEWTILEAVAERDVDLLVLEELAASPEFLTWWLDEASAQDSKGAAVIRAHHSVTHPSLGESDLVVIYSLPESEPHAVLIENKINAPAQPDQALRYRQRGEVGITAGTWKSFRTCIVAPQRYLDASSDAHLYDARISYEAIRSWLVGRNSDLRTEFRSRVLAEAIDQNRRGYTREADDRMTAFWHRYWECATEEFPELSLPEPGPKPAGSTWIEIRPEALGPGRRIYHKLVAGFVDLQLDGSAAQAEAIKSNLSSVLGSDTEVVVTGKSSSVRVRVPLLQPLADFGEQVSPARAGMRAAYRLLYIARAISAA
jgi:hypothetical protein